MKIHFIQHEPFEGPANIKRWADRNKHTTTTTKVFEGQLFPSELDFDLLIVMGGPMSVYDIEKHPFLTLEKKFIDSALEQERGVLGVCLGAQLVAEVLGGRVYPNREREVGWYPVTLTPEGRESMIFERFPNTFTALHWHGDTFELPAGTVHLARSEGCENQAFSYGGKVVGFQFHLEIGILAAQALIAASRDDFKPGRYVSTPEAIIADREAFSQCDSYLEDALRRLEAIILEGGEE